MSSESESTNEKTVPMELDLGSSAAAPKKTARKAAKKVARKVAKKAAKKVARKVAKKVTSDEGAEAKPVGKLKVSQLKRVVEAPSEFRPSDFKGRGSHFDGVDKLEVARDVPSEKSAKPAESVEKSEPSAKEESTSDESPKKSHGEGREREQRGEGNQNRRNNQNNRQPRHGGQQGNRNQGKKGNQPGPKARQKNQKGGPRNDRKGGGGWQQPLPPKETDQVGGILPASARYAKFENVEAIVAEFDQSQDPIDLAELYEMTVEQGRAGAEALGVVFEDKPGRKQIIEQVFKVAAENKLLFKDKGFLDLTDEGHGFVVHTASNYQLKPESVYVPASVINRYSLKRGHAFEVIATPPQEGERCPAAVKILSVMGGEVEAIANVAAFEDLTPYYPTERIVLETPLPSNSKKDVSMRAFDILTPIGLGQRGLIVAPPRTGKTVLLQGLAHSFQENYPNAHLIVLLIDERPEEVTDFKRAVTAEVVSSTFDETPSSHVHAAELVVEKARRMVEGGKDVVILLDSITRLARAYNALASNSGKIMSGGIEATALQKPKRFFGSARNIEEGGSLTIMGTALVDTGSKMDEVIFEEFKGTGNMEIHLDRDLINKRVFPAINFERSGTRKEELLYHPQELEKVYGLRRVMQGVPGVEAMEMLIKRLKATKSNAEFLMSLK
jgi:transcription termination factor Rho